ncbi:MAG: sialidase family protein [Pirellulales bacterium]
MMIFQLTRTTRVAWPWGSLAVLLVLLVTSAQSAEPAADNNVVPLSDALRARCLGILREGLKGEAFWPAMHAAEALSDGGYGAEVRDHLWPLAPQEKDDQRRCGLSREIVRSGDRQAIGGLFEVLAKDDVYGHTHAAESLYKIADVGDGRLLRRLYRTTPDIRRRLMAAAALARCGNADTLSWIRTQVAAGEPEPRKIAAWILARLGVDGDIAALKTARDAETDAVTKAYQNHALAALGDNSGREGLARNLFDKNDEVRTYANELVGHIRLVSLRDSLIKNLDDPFSDVRIRAAQSLLALSRPASKPVGDFSRDVFPASPANPRYSEGSIAVLRDGSLLYATTEFQGSGSDFAKARIVGRMSKDGGLNWDETRVLQENVGKRNVMSVSWLRPTLPQRDSHPLLMFFLQKDGFQDLDIYVRESIDEGKEFGLARQVTSQKGYHVMNNDRVVRLSTGRLLCPIASTADVEKENHFRSSCVISDDGGKTWRHGRGSVDQPKRGAMEPEVIELEDGRVLMIVRTQLGYIAAATSDDGGDSWGEPASWKVRSPESPATLRRVPTTGQLLLVWNDQFVAGAGHGGKRNPLAAALSSDEGKTWSPPVVLENATAQQYAYASLIFHQDRVLLSYYVADDQTGRISSRFRSLPLSSLMPSR